MQDQPENSRVDFGNFQLVYELAELSSFDDTEYIDENYVAILRFYDPGASVRVMVTATQLEVWRDYFELSATRGGAYMETLPIMRTRKEDESTLVTTYGNKIFFRSGNMIISINLAGCLKEFVNYINEIWRELDEKENRW